MLYACIIEHETWFEECLMSHDTHKKMEWGQSVWNIHIIYMVYKLTLREHLEHIQHTYHILIT